VKATIKKWQAFAGGVVLALGLLTGILLLQSERHGWPFSAHHRMPATAAAKPAVPVQAPRVPVTVSEGEAGTLGLQLSRVTAGDLTEQLRAVATVAPDESRISHVHTRVAGWIEKLHVSNTGETVRAGQPLVDIFSQELLASQTEYLAARRAGGPPSAVVESGRARLKVLGMSDSEIRSIEASGKPRRVVTLLAPRDGVMIHRGIAVGTAVDPSTELMIVADLSRVWVLAEVPEFGAAQIRKGIQAQLEFPASGLRPLTAAVEFVDPVLTEQTRTLRVRFALPNPDGRLRPGMYGTAIFKTQPRPTLTVPRDAVVDTGQSQHVYVATGPGQYEPRTVQLGARLQDRVEILGGLREGEEVVSSGVFLLDSESRLRASGGQGTSHAGHGGGAKATSPSGTNHEGHSAPSTPAAKGTGEGHAPAPAEATPDPHAGHGG
jgi:Cu(I)/Ag(I) efflux system membrane fusion protein